AARSSCESGERRPRPRLVLTEVSMSSALAEAPTPGSDSIPAVWQPASASARASMKGARNGWRVGSMKVRAGWESRMSVQMGYNHCKDGENSQRTVIDTLVRLI